MFFNAQNESTGWTYIRPGQTDVPCVTFANVTVTGYNGVTMLTDVPANLLEWADNDGNVELPARDPLVRADTSWRAACASIRPRHSLRSARPPHLPVPAPDRSLARHPHIGHRASTRGGRGYHGRGQAKSGLAMLVPNQRHRRPRPDFG